MPEKLTLAERLDLFGDPRMKDPAIRYQVLQRLDPEDKAWLLAREQDDAPPDTQASFKGAVENAASYARQNPAEVGAVLGGLAAIPMTGGMSVLPAMTAAGLAGTGGAGLGLLTSAALDPNSPAPGTSSGVLSEMLSQGAMQAGGEGAMRGAGLALRRSAPTVMEWGLQRSRAAKQDFPNAASRLVNDGVLPTERRIGSALNRTESKINADAAAFDARNPIGRVDPDTIAANARDFAFREGRVGGLGNVAGPESAELAALEQRYLGQNTRTRNLGETIEQKRAYASRSRYNNRPNAPTVTNNEINFNKGVAAENRKAAVQLNPALAEDLAREQDLIGALAAVQNRADSGMPNSLLGALKNVVLRPTPLGLGAMGVDRAGRALQAVDPAVIRALLTGVASQQPSE